MSLALHEQAIAQDDREGEPNNGVLRELYDYLAQCAVDGIGAGQWTVSDVVPARSLVLAADLGDRVRAMTLHHVDLSLLPLVEWAPCLFVDPENTNAIVHPDTMQLLRAEIDLAHGLGVPYEGERRL